MSKSREPRSWTGVELTSHPDAKDDHLLVPDGVLPDEDGKFPSLIVRVPPGKSGKRRLVSTSLIETAPGATAVRASQQLLTSLSAPRTEYVSGEVSPASAWERFRHDGVAQAQLVAGSCAFLGAAWEIFAATQGEPEWMKIVAGAITIVGLVVTGVLQRRR